MQAKARNVRLRQLIAIPLGHSRYSNRLFATCVFEPAIPDQYSTDLSKCLPITMNV